MTTFSIIVPIYNMEDLLARCLDSIINQTYSQLEIILVNDGSIDKSGEICDRYALKDNRFKVIHQPNAGVSEARNSGLKLASGDYISFVDPDDWIEKTMYERIVSHLDHTEIDVLRFNAYRNNDLLNELPFEGIFEGEQLQHEVLLPMIGATKFGGMFILGVLWIHIIRRSLIETHHIRFNKNIQRCEDRLFTMTSLLHASRAVFIKDILYHYEVNEDSLSNRHDALRWEQELLYLDELRKEYSHLPPDFVEEANKRIKSDYVLRAIASINNEFFSNNRNSFFYKYRRVSLIINNRQVISAMKNLETESLGAKGVLILFLIRNKQSLLLTLFETFILNVGHLRNKTKRHKNG